MARDPGAAYHSRRNLLAEQNRLIPVAVSLDLTFPALVAQSGLSITPGAEVSFYANGYE